MKKNIIDLIQFLIDTNQPEELCQYKSGKLSVITSSLHADLISDIDTPDFIKLSIREFGISTNKYIVSEIIPLDDAKELINNFWIKFEEKRNQKFIDNYGIDEYKSYYKSYLSAIKGETENDKFTISNQYNNGKGAFLLTNKENQLVTPLILFPNQKIHLDDEELFDRPNGAKVFKASTLIKPKDKDKYESGCFTIFIPNIKAKEYGLESNVMKEYNDDNIFIYLMDKVTDNRSKKIISNFELQQELPNKQNISANKKIKV